MKYEFETTEEYIKHLEGIGEIDPNCKTCQSVFYPAYRAGITSIFAPRHRPSPRCKSGKQPHCTCDTCF